MKRDTIAGVCRRTETSRNLVQCINHRTARRTSDPGCRSCTMTSSSIYYVYQPFVVVVYTRVIHFTLRCSISYDIYPPSEHLESLAIFEIRDGAQLLFYHKAWVRIGRFTATSCHFSHDSIIFLFSCIGIAYLSLLPVDTQTRPFRPDGVLICGFLR